MKGRGFRCGSEEKMMRMWFGLEIDVVGLPPLNGVTSICVLTVRRVFSYVFKIAPLLVLIKNSPQGNVQKVYVKIYIYLYNKTRHSYICCA